MKNKIELLSTRDRQYFAENYQFPPVYEQCGVGLLEIPKFWIGDTVSYAGTENSWPDLLIIGFFRDQNNNIYYEARPDGYSVSETEYVDEIDSMYQKNQNLNERKNEF